MRRGFTFFFVLGCGMGCALAQQSGADYQQAYQSWRATDANLERDAATAGAALGARADKVAEQASKYVAARKAYMDARKADLDKQAAALQAMSAFAASESDAGAEAIVVGETSSVANSISAVANDPDRGMQQLRQALEKERTALADLDSAVKDRRTLLDTLAQANASVEEQRAKATARYQALAAGLQQSSNQTGAQAAAWAEYYRMLAEGARGIASLSGVTVGSSGGSSVSGTGSLGTGGPPIPLSRYVGSWVYSTSNPFHHGVEPQIIDLVIKEEDGRAIGTMYARFRLPYDGPIDPTVRMEFSGPFQGTRNQVFSLQTSDGAQGRIELIPGPAFNLLEVNFVTDNKPGKLHDANFMVIKK